MEEGIGTLSVRVYTSQAQIPVVDTTVVVTQAGKEKRFELVSVQVTDRNGLIKPIPVHTPPKWQSTEPVPGKHPFAECQVWAEHPGFAILLVEGVQVFPGIETIQEMQLLPLGENDNSLQKWEEWSIPPQNL